MKILTMPFTDEVLRELKAGEHVELTGEIYTARDAAHGRLVELVNGGGALPFEFQGQAVFYAGPSPAPPGRIIGSIGPTTSGRMDTYSPLLIEHGLKVMIGKGKRSAEVKRAIAEYTGVYFTAIGGAAALLARCVRSSEVVAFPELGTEAVRRLVVERMPLVVAVDSCGGDVYESIEAH